MPIRKPNRHYRSREHLTPDEIDRLLKASQLRGRHQLRDSTLFLLMFRHGLRVTEASNLKWDAVMFDSASISIYRLKRGISGVHPLKEDELEALRSLKEQSKSHYLFCSERGGKLSSGAIAKIIRRAGDLAELPLPVHPHMLRHSCGYFLAEQELATRDIQEYLGHQNIQHTVGYTAANPKRFEKINWG